MTKATQISRRRLGQLAGSTLLAPALSTRVLGTPPEDTLTIGWVGPRSGPLGLFGQADDWIAELFNTKYADGVFIAGKRYALNLILRDTKSDPERAAKEAEDLIKGSNPDLMITSNTPETINPVADICEAMAMPCISTVAPWESVFFGRGGDPSNPFKWTFHFSFSATDFARLQDESWRTIQTNRKVGMLFPDDPDGNALRQLHIPKLESLGWDCFDAGPYQNGNSDYTRMIRQFIQREVEVIFTLPFPPDFPVFWRQAAQMGLSRQLKIMQVGKALLFAEELYPLGLLANRLGAGVFWHPAFPTRSPALGMTSAELGSAFEAKYDKLWSQVVGSQAALFDVALAAFKTSGAPKDKKALAGTLMNLITETAYGTVDFQNGPVPGVALTPLVATQWLPKPNGPYGLEVTIVAHDPTLKIPAQSKMVPLNSSV